MQLIYFKNFNYAIDLLLRLQAKTWVLNTYILK